MQEAPFVFRLLTLEFFELLKKQKLERLTEEAALSNYLKLFRDFHEIPLNVLVEPFVELLTVRLRGEKRKQISSAELQFVYEVSSHPKLSEPSVLLILELL